MNIPVKLSYPPEIESRLKPSLNAAFAQHEVPEELRQEIVKESLSHFNVYIDGSITPKSSYGSVDAFVKAYAEEHTTRAMRIKIEKEKIFAKLVECAEAGDMKNYRLVRAQYSSVR